MLQDVCASATQLVSIAPTQPGFSPPRPYVPPFAARQQQQQQQLKSLLTKEERDYFMELESEQLVETEDMSRQTTPGASRAPSPGPATALQPAAADLAAAITQHLGQGTPCSEEIVKHYPRVQASTQRGETGQRAHQWRRYSSCHHLPYHTTYPPAAALRLARPCLRPPLCRSSIANT